MPTTTWEYETMPWNERSSWSGGLRGINGIAEMLDAKGADGWELVTVMPDGEAAIFIFKRPVEPEAAEPNARLLS